jgi:glucosamine--fructose-6-phosphate aminotransferase (isomerizing)
MASGEIITLAWEADVKEAMLQQAAKAADYLSSIWEPVRTQVDELSLDPGEYDRIWFAGCGDSHHAAFVLGYACTVFTGIEARGTSALMTGRYLFPWARIGDRDLVVGISSSGEVARTLEVLEIAQEQSCRTVTITSNPDSKIAQTGDGIIAFDLPELPHGPGLLSYLGSLGAGLALIQRFTADGYSLEIDRVVDESDAIYDQWIKPEVARGREFAHQVQSSGAVFMGAGPNYASAMFAAAKVNEAAGEFAWAQDLEEWAHLEYFCSQPEMTTVILSAAGQSLSRETEVMSAAEALGRAIHLSRWDGLEGQPRIIREALSPLFMWAGPIGYAIERMDILDEQPFRGFTGGRSVVEGGGASRIRSSDRARLSDLLE